MIERSSRRVLAAVCFLALCCLSASTATAQITTGTVVGNVKDSSGGVVPGATIVLISDTKGTKGLPAVSNSTGDYVIPNVTPDTYTVEVTMDGFRTIKRAGIKVSGGDRVTVPNLTLEPGGAAETVNVTSEAPLIQASSGERSFAVSTTQIENLPVNHLGGGFTNFTAFTPGVVSGGASAGGTRLGGVGQNNIMMDGISAMDTGNNGQMLNMNVESIAEVKVLTQGYQAEYGRSSGLQITAVTKSGTNRFRGSAYDIKINSDWNENSWVNKSNGDPKPINKRDIWGYSLGGPVGKPGGNNKLFFFYSHEYRPTNSLINGGNPIRLRVPTAAERAGDFSQTRDNNGNLFNTIANTASGLPCSSTNTSGCFADGGVLGKIPSSALYAPGIAALNRYPQPNVEQIAGRSYNYELLTPPGTKQLTQQPAIRLDYQLSQKLRITGKYSGERQRVLTTPGIIQGFSDVIFPYPFITNYAVTANYAITPTMFVEGTYGLIKNELTGGNENGILVNDSANRLTSLPGFPTLYANAGVVPTNSYAYKVLNDVSPAFWDGTKMNLPPVFQWGSRIGSQPPNQRYPGWLNINRTQDFAVSLTKIAGRHTFKGGFYNNHSYKAQNVGAGGIANLTFQGYVDFGNNTNALDTGFGFANAATGVFTQFLQASNFVEGSMIYNQTEGYAQDNWKVNNKLTLDYGVRLTHQQPQYDQFQQMSNFFPSQWSLGAAPVLYVPGCKSGATVCSNNDLNAMDPRNGAILSATGAANTQAAIGTPIPGTGNSLNGIKRAGDGISKYGYTWPAIVAAPRFGAAYDLTGKQNLILRGGVGLFFDRPDGNTVFSIPGNPPMSTAQDLRNGTLQTLGQGLSPGPVPALVVFQYDAKVPASWQWQAGVQMALPWASSLDVSYVGNHGYNRLGGLQGGNTVNLNAVDIGAAYLAQNQDPTKGGASSVPGANAYQQTNLLRAFRGLSGISQNTTDFWDTYHSIQTSFQRRFQHGFSGGVNYTLALSLKGNTGTVRRLQHAADGTISLRPDQAQYEALFADLGPQRHVLKANAVWDLPDMSLASGGAKKVVAHIVNDWQISGVVTANSGTKYDLGFSYQNNGAAINLTGSPDYNARIVYVGDPGGGCSSNQYAQFNTASVKGPTYGSVGLESGRNILSNCPTKLVDLSLSRDIRLGGGRQVTFRLDAFNALNTVIYNARSTTVQYDNPTSQNIVNNQYNADGSLNQTRLTPRTAGFGAATNALDLRNFQAMIRFGF
jgi:hypothetical protein